MPVTEPFETVATEVLDDSHVTVSVQSSGLTVALSSMIFLSLIVRSVAFKVMDVAGTTTVTLHLSETFPHLTVIYVLPAATAVTLPSFTVATAGLELDHSSVLLVTLSGV